MGLSCPWLRREQLLDLGPVRVEGLAAPWGTPRGVRGAPQDVSADGLDVDAQAAGDFLLRYTFN